MGEGGYRRNIAIPFDMEKLEWCGYTRWCTIIEDVLIRFDRMYERDRHRDRQTPHDRIGRACIASHGKNYHTGCFKKVAPKTFWNIFISVKSFYTKFCKFVGNSYPHISTNFCRFTLIFHQMALIFPRVPIVFTLSSSE